MDIKITDITTTLLHNPEGFAIQDATIPPLKEGAKGSNRTGVGGAGDDSSGDCRGQRPLC